MKTTRPLWVAAIAWLAVVVLGSAVTWTVFDKTGHDIVATQDAPNQDEGTMNADPSMLESATSLATRGSASTGGDPAAPPPPSTTDESPGTDPSGRPTSRPTETSTGTPTQTPTSTADPSDSGSPSESPSGTSDPESGSWSGTAGDVSITCSGTDVTLNGATPNDGYSVEVERRRMRVDVTFEPDKGGANIEVRGTCPDGKPHFQVDIGDNNNSRI